MTSFRELYETSPGFLVFQFLSVNNNCANKYYNLASLLINEDTYLLSVFLLFFCQPLWGKARDDLKLLKYIPWFQSTRQKNITKQLRREFTWTLTQMVIVFLKNLNLSSLLNYLYCILFVKRSKNPRFLHDFLSVFIHRVGKVLGTRLLFDH